MRRGGDEDDFEDCFDSIWSRAVALGVRMGLSLPESEDVALDSLAIAYDRWARVRDLPWRDGWILKVVGNRALRQIHRNRPRPRLVPAPAGALDEEVTTRVAIQMGLAALPRRQREVVTLRFLADLREADVAAILGLDVGTVKQHASRGRAALEGKLADLSADASRSE